MIWSGICLNYIFVIFESCWTTSWNKHEWIGNSKSTILLVRFLRMHRLWQYQHLASNKFCGKPGILICTQIQYKWTVSEFTWVAFAVANANAKQTAWVTTNYILFVSGPAFRHSIIGASERLVLQFMVCTLQTELYTTFQLVMISIEHSMLFWTGQCYRWLCHAGTATSDALAQVRNLIVILDTWRNNCAKNWFDGQTSLKVMCFPHRDETFGILAYDSAKQSICSNWMVLDGMMFVTTNQWISQNFHQARLRLKAAGVELESDANQALTKILLVRRQVG